MSDAEVERLRAERDDVERKCAELRHERQAARLAGVDWRIRAEKASEAITVARRLMACSSHDWSVHPDDVRLYALLVGWDCELPEHADGSHDEIDCSGPNHLDSFAERFGWTKGGVAKLRAQRKAIAALAAPETSGGES